MQKEVWIPTPIEARELIDDHLASGQAERAFAYLGYTIASEALFSSLIEVIEDIQSMEAEGYTLREMADNAEAAFKKAQSSFIDWKQMCWRSSHLLSPGAAD